MVPLAGCTAIGGRPTGEHVHLPLPEGEKMKDEYAYPEYNEGAPDFTLPDMIRGNRVSLDELHSDRYLLLTFIYARCDVVCPVLVHTLARVKDKVAEHPVADRVNYAAITFDPKRDDEEQIRKFADTTKVDIEGPWYFLRPETEDEAERIVEKDYGVTFDKITSQGELLPENYSGTNYIYAHTPLVLLINRDGYVERAYQTKIPDADQIAEDLRKLHSQSGEETAGNG